jgi:hypothetical protein
MSGCVRPIAFALAMTVVACDGSSKQRIEPSDAIRAGIASAKARGDSTVAFISSVPNGSHFTLEVMRSHGTVGFVLKATATNAFLTLTDSIRTWHKFQLIEQMGTVAPSEDCPAAPTEVSLSTDEVIVPLTAGTVTLDGVTLMATTAESSLAFSLGATYFVLGRRCSNGVLMLEGAPDSVFAVEPGGDLRSNVQTTAESVLLADLRKYGTLDRLRAAFK